jgi:hypothetical protein
LARDLARRSVERCVPEEEVVVRRMLIVPLVAVLAVVVLATAAGATENRNFVAVLSGGEEVPAVDTHAHGLAHFQLNQDGNELAFKLIVANIEDVVASHIHCGTEGVNGPVVAFLYAGPVVSPDGILAQGTVTAADVIPRPDSPACPGGVATFDDLIAKMQSGGAYTNVHTVVNPGGEIRGEIRG